ncbi:MAG: MerR family transcriptional regulator [Bacteroidota bacterium]
MGTFSIKDIEALSGIRCHTLRIWEQRYGVLTPKRTDTNIRFYDDEDLKLILNISILNRYGYKISDISKMKNEEICSAVLKISGNSNEFSCQIKNLISATMVFDETNFNQIINENIEKLGFEQTMMKLIFPYLNEIGLLWQLGSVQPTHEHFATNIIKQKIYVAIDNQIGKSKVDAKNFLLFLPEKEQHTLGLMFANYIIRSRGHKVLYLGQEVPLKDLKTIFSNHDPDYIYTILTSANPEIDKQKFANTLSENWKESKILLSGFQFMDESIKLPQNAQIVRKMEDLISMLDSI